MQADWSALLSEGLEKLEIPREDTVLDGITLRGSEALHPLLSRYMDELELFNAVFDLVGSDSRAELTVRHILDSLAPWRHLVRLLASNPSAHLADAGTGAGLPGIPLALLLPGIQITLIERMSRRCSFLENCRAMLALSNTTVLETSVEQAPKGQYDLLVFRAFRPLDAKMYRALDGLLSSGGNIAAWKGKREKIDEEMAIISSIAGSWDALPVLVPFLEDTERYLVVIHTS